jgi:hypothetical protein
MGGRQMDAWAEWLFDRGTDGDKGRAFGEFYWVLKPGGRLSIFEPVGSFRGPEPRGLFLGCDVTPVDDLAE